MIREKYFNWIYYTLANNKKRTRRYRLVCEFLFSKKFFYTNDYDANRASDGLMLRERFADTHYVSEAEMAELNSYECSVFEMMIALALRCDESIMRDAAHGERTWLWFNEMLKSLHLDVMSNDNFDPDYCDVVVNKMLNKDYAPNGDGGLFTVRKKNVDMRKMEYWYQAMTYFNEYLGYE